MKSEVKGTATSKRLGNTDLELSLIAGLDRGPEIYCPDIYVSFHWKRPWFCLRSGDNLFVPHPFQFIIN